MQSPQTLAEKVLAVANLRPINKSQPAAPEPAYVPTTGMKETDTEQVKPFPMHVFPKRMRVIIEECEKYLSYPADFTAAGMLAASAIAAGRVFRLQHGWEEGTCLYMALVAPPGTAKSHPLEFALAPIQEADRAAFKEYNKKMTEHFEQGGEGKPPVPRQTVYSDFTIESLMDGIKRNKRGIAVYLDELRAWFANMNRYSDGSEIEFWLMNWSGKSISLNRKSGFSFIEKSFVSVVGTIQPSVLDDIGKGGRAQNGFTERMLFLFPDHVPVIKLKKRADRGSDQYHIMLKMWRETVQKILDQHFYGGNEGASEENPRVLVFTEAADNFMIDYLNELKDRMAVIDNEYLRNVYSKMQTYALRFALLLQILHEACNDTPADDYKMGADGKLEISLGIAERAQALTEFFISHALKANGIINAQNPLGRLPSNVRKWYGSLPTGVEFTTKMAEEKAILFQISRSTMFEMLSQRDPKKQLFQKIKTGSYEKLYHQ